MVSWIAPSVRDRPSNFADFRGFSGQISLIISPSIPLCAAPKSEHVREGALFDKMSSIDFHQ
jgi:hypothetical protein